MADQNARHVMENVNIPVIGDNKRMAHLVIGLLHALGVTNTCQAAGEAQTPA